MYNFEALAIKSLINGQPDIIPHVKLDMFTDKYSRLYKLCLEFFEAHKKLPNYMELQAVIEAKAPINVKGAYQSILSSIDSMEMQVDTSVIANGVREQATLRQVDNDIEALVQASRDREVTKVKQLVNKLNNKINLQGLAVTEFADAKDSEDSHNIVASFLDDESEDKFLGGGHSGLTIISAVSGGGKSVALLKAAKRNYEKGKNVEVITLELPKKVMYNRLMANLTGIDFTKINRDNLTAEERMIINNAHDEFFKKDNTNKFKILDEPIDDMQLLNLIAVEAQLNNIEVFIIDYIQLVEISASGDEWRGLSSLAKKLHKLTRTFGITIITASQVNVEGKVKGTIMPNITTRGSKELEFSSTQFLHLDIEPDTQALIMYTKKNRIAEPQHVILEKDFAHMDIICTGLPLSPGV